MPKLSSQLQYVFPMKVEGYTVELIIRYDPYLHKGLFVGRKSVLEKDLEIIQRLGAQPETQDWENSDIHFELKEDDKEENPPKSVVTMYARNPQKISAERYISICNAFTVKLWEDLLQREGKILIKHLQQQASERYAYHFNLKRQGKTARAFDARKVRIVLTVINSQTTVGVALNHDRISDAHLVYYGVSGRTILARVVLPALLGGNPDYDYLYYTWVHELEHQEQNFRGQMRRDILLEERRSTAVQREQLTTQSKVMQDVCDLIYVEGMATFSEYINRTVEYNQDRLRNLIRLLEEISAVDTEDEAMEKRWEFLNDVYDGEYYVGHLIVYLIAQHEQAVLQLAEGKSEKIDIVKDGTTFEVPAQQLKALIQTGHVIFAPIRNQYRDAILERLRSLKKTRALIRRYELACEYFNIPIKNRILTMQKINMLYRTK